MQRRIPYSLYFWLITLALVLVKVLFTLRPEINLFTEEAQYWLWSKNLAWHYYSKPPLVAFLNYISTSVFGDTELAVRLNAILSGVGISYVIFLFGSYLYSVRTGFWSALVVQAMPVWWLASTFHMTDSSLTFFWTLSIYLAYRAIDERKLSWWLWAGIATAFGIMAKVVMLLIFPVVLLFLIYRGTWKSELKYLGLFFAVSMLGFIPALIWNWENNFDTFKHLAALGGAGGGASKPFDAGDSLKWFLEYWSGQLAIISAFLLPAWFFAFKEVFKNKSQRSIYLLLPAIMTFAAFAMMSFLKRVEVNWPVFAYTGLAIVLGRWISMQTKAWKRFSAIAIGISIVIPALFLLPDFSGLKSIPTISSGEQKAVKRLSGHRELAERLDFLMDSLQIKNEFYFSDSYHTASELSFYLQGHPQSYVMNMGSRKDQFDLWEDMSQFIGQKKTGVFVSMNHDSMQDWSTFERLVYEEKFVPLYKGVPIRSVKIEVWENLITFTPFEPGTY